MQPSNGTRTRAIRVGQVFNPFQMFTGVFIPEGITRLRSIKAGSKIVYARLLRYAGENGEAFPRVDTLGAECGISENMARLHIQELTKKGLIRPAIRYDPNTRRQTSNVYHFLWHACFMGEIGTPHTHPPAQRPTEPESLKTGEQKGKTEIEGYKILDPSISDEGYKILDPSISTFEGSRILEGGGSRILDPKKIIRNIRNRSASSAAAALPGFQQAEAPQPKPAAAAANSKTAKKPPQPTNPEKIPPQSQKPAPEIDEAINRVIAASPQDVAAITAAAREIDPEATNEQIAAAVGLVAIPREGIKSPARFFEAALSRVMQSSRYRRLKTAATKARPAPEENAEDERATVAQLRSEFDADPTALEDIKNNPGIQLSIRRHDAELAMRIYGPEQILV